MDCSGNDDNVHIDISGNIHNSEIENLFIDISGNKQTEIRNVSNSHDNNDTCYYNTVLKTLQYYTNGTFIDKYLKSPILQSRNGNILFAEKDVHKNKINELNQEIEQLKLRIYAMENKSWGDYIDKHIDTWFENNKSDVDIGVVNVCGLFTIDLLPDTVEKYIYKKVVKIVFSLVTDLKIK